MQKERQSRNKTNSIRVSTEYFHSILQVALMYIVPIFLSIKFILFVFILKLSTVPFNKS